jgi:6-phosphofructokinase 1
VPKTIDNDLAATDYSFGFDTAVQIATEASTACAPPPTRTALHGARGHGPPCRLDRPALGMAGGAHAILIPEQPQSIEQICEWVESVRDRGLRPLVGRGRGFTLRA